MVEKKSVGLMTIGLFLSVIFVCLFVLSFVGASSVSLKNDISEGVVIAESGNPVKFNLTINNLYGEDQAEIYSLVGVSFTPRGNFNLPLGLNVIPVSATLNKDWLKNEGVFAFEYNLRGQNFGIVSDKFIAKIIPLRDLFLIQPANVNPDDSNSIIYVRNVQNTEVDNASLRFESPFYDYKTLVSLKPFEGVNITIPLNEKKLKGLKAGNYFSEVNVQWKSGETDVKEAFKYLEKEKISVVETHEGFFTRTGEIIRTNEGNTAAIAKTEMSRDIFTRLFTTYSVEPEHADRSGLVVKYSWSKELSPGESFVVKSRTNYFFPFLIVAILIVAIYFAKMYSLRPVEAKKTVSLVRTKGGEFALRVTLRVKARKHVDRVQVIDALPEMTKLYERFGREPDKIDAGSRRMFWNLNRLNSGEERVFSYIIYSRISTVGRFVLPAATVIFEKDGKTEEVVSNRAFFVSDTLGKN